jgi:hypothetical protein
VAYTQAIAIVNGLTYVVEVVKLGQQCLDVLAHPCLFAVGNTKELANSLLVNCFDQFSRVLCLNMFVSPSFWKVAH